AAEDDPGRRPDIAGNPGPAELRIARPGAVMVWDRAPFVGRYPGPAEIAVHPVAVRVGVPADHLEMGDPDLAVARRDMPAAEPIERRVEELERDAGPGCGCGRGHYGRECDRGERRARQRARAPTNRTRNSSGHVRTSWPDGDVRAPARSADRSGGIGRSRAGAREQSHGRSELSDRRLVFGAVEATVLV